MANMTDKQVNLKDELNNLHEQFLNLTEGGLEQRYHILNSAEQNLVHSHSEQLRNVGIISGVVAPFSLTLLQLDSVDVNVYLLLMGFGILIINIALSQILLHRELAKKNKLVTDASVKLNFASICRENLQNRDCTKKVSEIEPLSFFMQNIREVDKALGLSTHNLESLMTKMQFRKYDQLVVFLHWGAFSLFRRYSSTLLFML